MIDYLNMVKRVSVSILVVCILVVGCSAPAEPASPEPTEGPAAPTVKVEPIQATSTSEPEEVVLETSEPAATAVIVTPEDECPGEDTNTIGMGIAEEYEFTSYEQVMTWFCDGAEFEDILVALQTEELSDTPAEEMLVMLAEGFTWEDIWLVVDLIE
jgi:hypothetical protein